MVSHGQIEDAAASIVREYLSRKDCKSTLKTFDAEMPRTEGSISNRSLLAREVHIEKIMRKNKEATQPLRTMIEVIVKFLIERSSKDGEGVPEQRSSTDLEKSSKRSSRPSSARREKSTSSGAVPSSAKEQSPVIEQEFSGMPQADRGLGSLQREATTVVTMKNKPNVKSTAESSFENDLHPAKSRESLASHDHGLKLSSSSPSTSSTKREDDLSKKNSSKRPGSASRSRGLAGPISSSLEAHDRRRHQKSTKPALSPSLSTPSVSTSLHEDISSPGLDMSASKKSTSSSSRDKLKSFGFDISPENTSDGIAGIAKMAPKTEPPASSNDSSLLDAGLDGRTSPTKDSRGSRHRRSLDESANLVGSGASVKPKTSNGVTSPKKTTSKKKETSMLGDLEMGDVDDLEDDLRDIKLGAYTPSSKKPIDTRPITLQLAMQLKSLLFGSSTGCFNDEWRLQGFGFNEIANLAYGIVQHKGGPCGVLASVQACMLQKLLFGEDSSSKTVANLKESSVKKRTECLIQAIADIVWRAGQKRSCVIALPAPRAHFAGGGRFKSDGLTEMINLNLFKSREEVVEFVRGNIRAFIDSRGSGCILLLYSAIFSRTLDMVIEDMDVAENTLLGAHGYCTQEMVNLILTGKAVSNVFNDVVELGTGKDVTRLQGLTGRSDIGLMSLYEHYKSCQVGTFYKTPRYPIWVVCSESHFSVLFSIKKELVSDWRMERRFDLYYYDGLAKQQEEFRLTIDTSQPCPPSDVDDLIPPLEHCIRTKWPEACVDWNGSEPIL